MGWPFSGVGETLEGSDLSIPPRIVFILGREGIVYSSPINSDNNWLTISTAVGCQAGLAALLSQLEEEGFAHWRGSDLLLQWPSFYELVRNSEFSDSIELLGMPGLQDWRPVLASRGSLGDQEFSVILSGWIDPHGRPVQGDVALSGAQVAHGQTKALLPQAAWETVEALAAFHQRPLEERNLEANKLAWAAIRRAAVRANADLADFLRKTIVLTPERLNIELRKAQFGESKTVEVLPKFEGAPDRWLEIFDRFPDVKERYEITDGEGMVHIVLPPEVQTVLREIKRMPGRRVAGERAEAFVRNPFSTLGPDASRTIDPVLFEKAREKAGISFVSFIAQAQRDQQGIPQRISLLVEEPVQGEIRSEEICFSGADDLEKFVSKLKGKIARGAQCCFWEGYDLEILGDTQDQLALLEDALRDLRSSSEFSAAEIFDLSRYSDRVLGFGVEKPYYSPYITKKNDDGGWFPENIIFGLFYTPEGADEPIALDLTEERLVQLKVELQKAKDEDRKSFDFLGCPQPLTVAEAEEMVSIFHDAGRDVAKGSFDPTTATKGGLGS